MGLCRFWVYVIAGTAGVDGLNGGPVWCGAALAFYVAGLSYVAKRESFRGPIPHWPLILLAAPILLALLMNMGDALKPALSVSLILALWMARCLRTIFQPGEINVGGFRFRPARGDYLCGLARGRAAMPALAGRSVFDFIWHDAFVAAFYSGNLN